MTTMNEPRFWMVYGMGQGQPTARHKTFDSARAEASRLARLNPGIDFFVLEAVGAARKVDVEFTDLRRLAGEVGRTLDDDIPF